MRHSSKFIDQIDDRPGRRTIQISLSLPTQLLDAIDERAKGLGKIESRIN